MWAKKLLATDNATDCRHLHSLPGSHRLRRIHGMCRLEGSQVTALFCAPWRHSGDEPHPEHHAHEITWHALARHQDELWEDEDHSSGHISTTFPDPPPPPPLPFSWGPAHIQSACSPCVRLSLETTPCHPQQCMSHVSGINTCLCYHARLGLAAHTKRHQSLSDHRVTIPRFWHLPTSDCASSHHHVCAPMCCLQEIFMHTRRRPGNNGADSK